MMDKKHGLSRLLVVLASAAGLVACGGGSDQESLADSPSVAELPGGPAQSKDGSILNEWEGYADPDAPQPSASDPDPFEVVLGKGARISREELAAAQSAAEQAAQTKAFVQKSAVGLVPVYRFLNTSTKAHFYTASEAEKDNVIASVPGFDYEGAAFEVSPTLQSGLSPVYRFFNTKSGVHFYTISEDERALILANLPHFNDEGIAYYASKVSAVGMTPLYRFYRQSAGVHFYTANYTERDQVISNNCSFRYEGTGYYVFDSNAVANAPETTPNAVVLVVGDSLSEGYGVSIGGTVYSFVSKGQVWTERLASEIKTRTGRNCNTLVDVSVGGMRTVEGVNSIQAWLDLYSPTHVILAQGTNDAWQGRSLSSMSTNLKTMTQASKDIGASVYVMEFPFYPNGTAYRQTMTAMYQGVATDKSVNYFSATANVPATSTYYHTDSVHLKDAAQTRVLETVWAAIQPGL
jgi:lysophospholipase L1-like esterase/plasmid stabilization system protein ParE